MTYTKGLHPGAIWKKADFQIHSPRDINWTGPTFAGGTQPLEQAREDWADSFVEECTRRGLGAIAVTDHHDFVLVPYIQRAIVRKGLADKLWFFPGVEVTCDDAVQCLVLFDVQTQEDRWHRLFGGHLQKVELPNANAAATAAVTPCGKNVEKFIDDIAADAILSACSIVLPHASDSGAHKSMIRPGFHTRFKDLPFDGIYTDKAFDALDGVTRRKIFGEVLEWGSRRRGILPTGDNPVAHLRTFRKTQLLDSLRGADH